MEELLLAGSIVGQGQGKDPDGACGELAAEGVDERAHGGAGGKDVVDEEEGGWGGIGRLCG